MDQRALAIVTGANGNLGSAVVTRLAAAGFRVARAERTHLRLEGAFEAPLDLGRAGSANAAFEALAAQTGPLLAVVHTVGIYRGGVSVVDATRAEFTELFETNVVTTLHVLQAALRIMLPQKRGRIAVVASSDALLGPAKHAGYAASKAAQLRLVESAAAEAKAHGVGVNAVLPSTMDTPQNRAAMPDADRSAWLQLSDVANVLAYLVSTESSALQGQALRL